MSGNQIQIQHFYTTSCNAHSKADLMKVWIRLLQYGDV